MRFQYNNPFNKLNIRFNKSLPETVKFIIIVNVIIFIITEIFGLKYIFFEIFGLIPRFSWESLKIWQPLTYIFLHSGFFHIFINMLVLWMFGKELEYRWGKNKFLLYYLVTGIGSGILTVLYDPYSIIPIVGASGAIYGILIAYTLIYPNRKVYIYGIFPMQIKFMMILLGLTAFFASFLQTNSSISHVTHLAGMVVGFIFLKWNNIKRIFPKVRIYEQENIFEQPISNKKDDLDIILEKLKLKGWEGLNEFERNKLFNASRNHTKDQTPN